MTLDGSASVLERLVVDRIEHRDDVAVDVDRVRHVHVAAERAAQAFGDHGLAVSGRAVEEHRLAGVDRRAELLEHLVADDQVREALPQPLAIDVAARRRERAHLRDVGGQRHRRRADVLADVEVLARAIAAGVGQRVAVARRARSGGAAHFDELLGAHALDERLEHRERQPQAVGEREAGRLAAVERLDQQLLDLIRAQAGVLRASSAPAAAAPCSGLRSSERGRRLLSSFVAPSARGLR